MVSLSPLPKMFTCDDNAMASDAGRIATLCLASSLTGVPTPVYAAYPGSTTAPVLIPIVNEPIVMYLISAL